MSNDHEPGDESSDEEDDVVPISSFENKVDRPGVLTALKGHVMPKTKSNFEDITQDEWKIYEEDCKEQKLDKDDPANKEWWSNYWITQGREAYQNARKPKRRKKNK